MQETIGAAGLSRHQMRVPSMRANRCQRQNYPGQCDEHHFFAKEVEDQDS